MPNPSIAPQKHFRDDRPGAGWMPHNGWLSRIPGDQRGFRDANFPKPDAAVESPRFVELTVPDLGRVRIRYEACSYLHYRNRHWHWSAVWADKLDEAGNVIEHDGA